MPFAKAHDGATLHYAVHDYTDPWRKAPTIILQHGFGRSGRFWFNVVPYLARFFRVICPDIRGLGESIPLADPARTLTVANCIADLNAVADHAGAERFHLVGESIAGGLGLMFAGEHSDRLRTLCVIAPAVYANEWIRKAYAVGFPTWEEAIRTLGVEGWVRASNTLARFPSDADPAFLEWYAKEVGRNDVESVAAMTRFAASVDARPYLERIEAPVLAIFPTSGQIASQALEDLLHASIRNLQVTHLASPYQMLNMLEPAACAQQILNFAALEEGFVARD
jgi:3-oxoadipate enol-lactonase